MNRAAVASPDLTRSHCTKCDHGGKGHAGGTGTGTRRDHGDEDQEGGESQGSGEPSTTTTGISPPNARTLGTFLAIASLLAALTDRR